MNTNKINKNSTSWMERFRQALAIMCNSELPPLEYCEQWIYEHVISYDLQEWVLGKVKVSWASGIGTIEVAEIWANSPVEGEDHRGKPKIVIPVEDIHIIQLVNITIDNYINKIEENVLPLFKIGFNYFVNSINENQIIELKSSIKNYLERTFNNTDGYSYIAQYIDSLTKIDYTNTDILYSSEFNLISLYSPQNLAIMGNKYFNGKEVIPSIDNEKSNRYKTVCSEEIIKLYRKD